MSNGFKFALTFIAACIGALAVIDPIGLPTWVQGVAVILSTGFAAVGIPAGYTEHGVPASRVRQP